MLNATRPTIISRCAMDMPASDGEDNYFHDQRNVLFHIHPWMPSVIRFLHVIGYVYFKRCFLCILLFKNFRTVSQIILIYVEV